MASEYIYICRYRVDIYMIIGEGPQTKSSLSLSVSIKGLVKGFNGFRGIGYDCCFSLANSVQGTIDSS